MVLEHRKSHFFKRVPRKWERRAGCGDDYLGTPSGESFQGREFLLDWFKGKRGNEGKFMIHDTNNRDSAAILVPQYFMLLSENI